MYQLMRNVSANGKLDDSRLMKLSDNQVPLQWKRLWSGPKSATNYLPAISARAFAAEQRLLHGGGIPQRIDMATIFNVDTFLATLKLIVARDHPEGISTTEIGLSLRLANRGGTSRDVLNSVVIAPLIIEGGLNVDESSGMLVNARNSTATTTLTPELILVLSRIKAPVGHEPEDAWSEDEGGEIIVPLYANGNREKLICTFQMPIADTLRTVAAYSGLALIIPDVPL